MSSLNIPISTANHYNAAVTGFNYLFDSTQFVPTLRYTLPPEIIFLRQELATFNLFTTYGLFGLTCEYGLFNLEQASLEPPALKQLIAWQSHHNIQDLLPDGSCIFSVSERLVDLLHLLSDARLESRKYIVLLGRSDIDISDQIITAILDTNRVTHIFSQNCSLNLLDPAFLGRVTKLPLGFENKHFNGTSHPWNSPDLLREAYLRYLSCCNSKDLIALAAFGLRSNLRERKNALNHIIRSPISLMPSGRHSSSTELQLSFYSHLSRSSFCFAPQGNGADTHRFWLSLLFFSVPIITSTSIYDGLEGLPCISLNSWSDLSHLSFHDLLIYHSFSPSDFHSYLSLSYWANRLSSRKSTMINA
jgi:hypothetical protein